MSRLIPAIRCRTGRLAAAHCAASLTVIALACWAIGPAGAAEFRLRPRAEVAQPLVTLGDVAEVIDGIPEDAIVVTHPSDTVEDGVAVAER